jgi:hypothetical protein
VLTKTKPKSRVAKSGVRRVAPLLKPLDSSTMRPLGNRQGEATPLRTAGSTTLLSTLKKFRSIDLVLIAIGHFLGVKSGC